MVSAAARLVGLHHAHGLLHYLARAAIFHFLLRSGGIALVLVTIALLWLVLRLRRRRAV